MAKSITYFGGANGEKGFVSYFGGALVSVERLYILKGGCGCGKSALMKKLAAEAEKRGLSVERILCASDPSSLDGVVIPEKSVGMVDGTAPHEISPRLPGAADTLVDLGEYWDGAALRSRSEEIRTLTRAKADCQSRAYSLMAAVGCLKEELDRLLQDAILWDKMYRAAGRIISKTASLGEGFSITLRPRSAFCSQGTVYTESYGETLRIPLKDPHGIAHLFYEQLLSAAFEKRLSVTVSPHPLSPERMDGLMLNTSGTLFCESGEGKPVNLDRFLSAEGLSATRGKRRFISKAVKSLTDAAARSMAESRSHHAALEAIYTPAMDFGKVDQRAAQIMAEVFG